MNAILIFFDDLGPQVAGQVFTSALVPGMTALKAAGVNFTRAYTPSPICGPSRASLYTGKTSRHHGVWMNEPPYGGAALFDDSATLFTALAAAGVRTGQIGKLLNAKNDWAHATSTPRDDPEYVWQGLDYSYEVCIPADPTDGSGGSYNYWTAESYGGAAPTMALHGTAQADYQTDVLAQKLLDFMDGAEPYGVIVNVHAPHQEHPVACSSMNDGLPLTLPVAANRHAGAAAGITLPQGGAFNEAWTTFQYKPAALRSRPQYTAPQIACLQTLYQRQIESVIAVDDLLVAVVAKLAAQGRLSNTLVGVGSDNGFKFGQHREHSKDCHHEESMRVPLILRGPGITAGLTSTRHVLPPLDVMPTLLELFGATTPLTMDGRSLVPLFSDGAYLPWRRRWFGELRFGATSGSKIVRTTPEATDAPDEAYIVQTPDGSPNEQYGPGDGVQLYNHFTDGAAPWPAHRAAMQSKMDAFPAASGPTYRALEDA